MAITHTVKQSEFWKEKDHFNQLPNTLIELQDTLSKLSEYVKNTTTKNKVILNKYQKDIEEKYDSLQDLDVITRDEFSDTEKLIKDKKLSQQVRERHKALVSRYDEQMHLLMPRLNTIVKSSNKDEIAAATIAALNQLKQFKHKRTHQTLNSEQMPFGVSPNNARKPITDVNKLNEMLGIAPQSTQGTSARAVTVPVDTTAPTAADLAQTIDVQITPDIQALADSLGNDPVAIYNWVYNNIYFVPSYGSIQGSQLTMDNKKGNAFDTASLLIALLRASNVPARYKYGTIEVPIEAAQNWVGGVDNPQSVQILLGQGSIPNVLMSSGGAVESVRLEHVWVEVFGAFSSSGSDAWVPLDASFKQYNIVNGMNISENNSGTDFVTTMIDNLSVMESEGSIRVLDETIFKEQMDLYEQQINNYVASQNPSANVGEVLGSIEIIHTNALNFDGVLPYDGIISSSPMSELSDNLRHKFKYSLLDEYGVEYITIEKTLPEIAGDLLALSFKPSTPDDASTLRNILPENPSDQNELPSSLPYGVINVDAEFTVNGVEVGGVGSFPLGEEMKVELGLWAPGGGWESSNNSLFAGQYQAIGLDYHGINEYQIDEIKSKIDTARIQIEANNVSSLTKHDITGALLQNGILLYFGVNDLLSEASARESNVVFYRQPSYGTFSTALQLEYFFGIPRNVTFPGVEVDVDRVSANTETKNNCWEDWVTFNRISGMRLSAYEHLVPEEIFKTNDLNPQGISAVKALATAASQGQNIYTLNASNVNAILPQLNIDYDIKSEILTAVSQGKEATVSESEVNINGWIGVGYLIIDPDTGAGAYKISGGTNGGFVILAIFGMIFMFLALLPFALLGGAALLAAWAIPFLVGAALYAFAIYQMTKDWTLNDWVGFLKFFKPVLVAVTMLRLILMAAGIFTISIPTLILFMLLNLRSDTRQP
jgi:hypothetical protein